MDNKLSNQPYNTHVKGPPPVARVEQVIPPPAPAPALHNYSVQDFVQYTTRGTDLPGQPMRGTVAECETACSAQPSCLGFSRSKYSTPNASEDCWLKQNMDSKSPNQPYNTHVKGSPTGATANQMQPAASSHTYSVKDFVQYTEAGTDLPSQPMLGTVTDCEIACSAQPSCLGFSRSKYSSPDRYDSCWLKKNMNNKSPQQMYNTYVKN
jgi:hypothetical protein